jgi:acetyl-CoA carboxylase carboxyl transferase subunit alpha
MRITAQDLKRLGVIDEIIAEPVGGAHRSPSAAIEALGVAIGKSLDSLARLNRDQVKQERRDKFLAMGGL